MFTRDDEGPGYTKPSAPSLHAASSLSDLLTNIPKELKEDFTALRKELKTNGMQNHEARVCLILDISGSMQNPNKFFDDKVKGNRVQGLINKALTMALAFDDNQSVELFAFGDKSYFCEEPINRDNFMHATEIVLKSAGGLKNETNYAAPVAAVREHYFKNSELLKKQQPCDEPPVFAIFITDGEPNTAKHEAMKQFKAASHQAIFFKFIALKGQQEDQEFTFLQNIDDHQVKEHKDDDSFFIDNSDLVVLNDPKELTMQQLINEYRPWLMEAYKKRLLLNNPGLDVKNMEIKHEDRKVASALSKNSIYNKNQNIHKDEPQQPRRKKSFCAIM